MTTRQAHLTFRFSRTDDNEHFQDTYYLPPERISHLEIPSWLPRLIALIASMSQQTDPASPVTTVW